ncbi:hypothetical protein [Limosilactobacillus agrestimuris]|uniref:hypothetical protein n=1 Tax=Limosilactobacillus agrestimuris TaxID=2941331 RepID=UPI0020404494|nr:hypothetical protein [Limosilactobacillus agrestimuris]
MNDSNSPISEVNRYVKFVSDTVEGGTFKAEGSFDDIYIPPVTNYVTYKGIKDENNVIEKSANGKVKTGETPISKIGEEPQLTFPHDDYVEYMVYLTKSDKPQPSPNPQTRTNARTATKF